MKRRRTKRTGGKKRRRTDQMEESASVLSMSAETARSHAAPYAATTSTRPMWPEALVTRVLPMVKFNTRGAVYPCLYGAEEDNELFKGASVSGASQQVCLLAARATLPGESYGAVPLFSHGQSIIRHLGCLELLQMCLIRCVTALDVRLCLL